MKITVYTITDCQFSKQEKEYLTSHQLQYEEKNLETNKEFLTEMLAVSNNFAGTPVTKIEKDDGQIVVLKGFTKEEFDKTLGLASAGESSKGEEPAKKVEPTEPATKPEEPKAVQSPPPPPAPSAPTDQTNQQQADDLSADSSSKVSTTEEASSKADPLNSILNDLQTKSTQADSNQPADSSAGPTQTDSTQHPAPAIPDFPSKT